jgi:hypothetical protein
MSLSELTNIVNDFAEIAVTILLAYVAYKVAMLVDTLNHKIKKEEK